MPRSNSGSAANNHAATIGHLGEELVARWWRSQGWLVLQRRWRCRWGELDLIVGQPALEQPDRPINLAFVEVKTRQEGNWDSDGALALDYRKQAKLGKTAQLFLAHAPTLAQLPCRFDLALVGWRSLPAGPLTLSKPDSKILIAQGYELALQDYIPAAFTL